jgi:hypothetical protein
MLGSIMKKAWLLFFAAAVMSLAEIGEEGQAEAPKMPSEIWQKAQEKDFIRVTVALNVPFRPEKLNQAEESKQRTAIAAAQKSLLEQLKGTKYKVLRQSRSAPFIHLEVDRIGLSILDTSDLVKSVSSEAEKIYERFLHQSVPLVGGTPAFYSEWKTAQVNGPRRPVFSGFG